MSAVDVEGERLLEERARVVEGALMTLLKYVSKVGAGVC